jgi:hypothetical protein
VKRVKASVELGLGEGTGWSRSGLNTTVITRCFEYFINHEYISLMGMKLLAGRI